MRTLGSISHPNVVPLLGVYCSAWHTGLVLEQLAYSLYSLLHEQHAAPPWSTALLLARSAAAGIAQRAFFFEISRSMPTANAGDPCGSEGA